MAFVIDKCIGVGAINNVLEINVSSCFRLELGVSDQSAVLLHLEEISSLSSQSLSSTSWPHRIQGANTLAATATLLGSSYPPQYLVANVNLLLNSTTGRTFPGKSAILAALSKFLTAPKRTSLSDLGLDEANVVGVFLRETRKKDCEYVSQVMRAFGDLLLGVEVSDCWESIWEICSSHLLPKEEDEDENNENKEKRKKTEMFTIQSVVQESAVLLLGVGWRVCQEKAKRIINLCEFLAGNMRICTWKIQITMLCSIQHVLQSFLPSSNPDSGQKVAPVSLDPFQKQNIYETLLPAILRCVDDTKHVAVRGLSLKLTFLILNSCKSDEVQMREEVVKDVLVHVRDQVSMEGNHNLKAQGIEIVSLLEKNFS